MKRIRKPKGLKIFEKFFNPQFRPEAQIKIWEAFNYNWQVEVEKVRQQLKINELGEKNEDERYI